MKNIYSTLIFSTLFSLSILAQDHQIKNTENIKTDDYQIKTLFGGKHKANGGYGALMFNYGDMAGEGVFLLGARGSWVFNHSFSMGIGGYGITNAVGYDFYNTSNNQLLINGGYGGLFIEPIIASRWPIHIALPILFGVGGIAYGEVSYADGDYWTDAAYTDVVLVVEPGVSIEMNVTKFFRLGLNATYRYFQGVTYAGVGKESLNGISGGLTMKFGKF